MSTLSEVITSESVKRLHKAFTDGMEMALADATGALPGINKRTFELVAEPLARWVHYRLVQSASVIPNPPNPEFPYRPSISISEILAQEGFERGKSRRMVGDISRTLKFNRLLFNAGDKGLGASIWLKSWDPGLDLQYVDSHWTPDHKVEKRIAEEDDKPVTTRIDLRSFKVPEPTPDKILDFIQHFVPAALKVQDQLTEARRRLLEAETRAIELEAQINSKAESEAWEGVTDTLSNLLDGERTEAKASSSK